MATGATLRLKPMADNLANILAIELLEAAQAIGFHRPLTSIPAPPRIGAATGRRRRI